MSKRIANVEETTSTSSRFCFCNRIQNRYGKQSQNVQRKRKKKKSKTQIILKPNLFPKIHQKQKGRVEGTWNYCLELKKQSTEKALLET
uniref:Uncharacterized protein n=1 Tax=Noccaea caerulescens TaxID=107243 RepID=A0A1J3HSR1_NOCCA